MYNAEGTSKSNSKFLNLNAKRIAVSERGLKKRPNPVF